VFDSRVIHRKRVTSQGMKKRGPESRETKRCQGGRGSRTPVRRPRPTPAARRYRAIMGHVSRRWLSSDSTCVTSRTRQVRSLRAARILFLSEHSSTARSLPSEGRDGGSNPPAQTTYRCSPTGRGCSFRNCVVRVRLPSSVPPDRRMSSWWNGIHTSLRCWARKRV
jgi:hypothetical protein